MTQNETQPKRIDAAEDVSLATEARPQVAVIIPHFNDLDRLKRCLSALVGDGPAQKKPDDVDIVVVDNNSPVDIGPVRDAYPAVRFFIEETPGAAEARNRGVRETNSPLLFFIDADCIPAPDWLEVGRRVASRADLVGGRIETFDETPPPRSGAEAFETVFAFQQRRYIEDQHFSVTANLLTSRSVFQEVGPFRAGVSEDKDWCLRAREKGYTLAYADELRVLHPSRADWDALWKKWRRLSSEGFHLSGRRPLDRVKWMIRSIAVFASAFLHAPRVLRSPVLRSKTERWRGLTTLFRIRGYRAVFMVWQSLGGE